MSETSKRDILEKKAKEWMEARGNRCTKEPQGFYRNIVEDAYVEGYIQGLQDAIAHLQGEQVDVLK